MKNNKAFAPILILIAVLAVLAIGGSAYYMGKSSTSAPQNTQDNNYQPTEQNVPVDNSNKSIPTNNNNVNTITQSIKVTFPTTGSTLTEGQMYSITWENSNTANVTYGIYLENDKAGSIRIGETSKKYFSWKVPSILDYMNGGDSYTKIAPMDGYRISLTNLSDSKKYYSSIFKIFPLVAQDIKFTFPTTGSTLMEGQTYNIAWESSDKQNTNYGLYLENDKVGSIRIGETSQKSFSWKVPSILSYLGSADGYKGGSAPTDGYRVSLTNLSNSKVNYSSVFKIVK